MTFRDLKQISVWAVITALLVIGTLASRSAIGDDPASEPEVMTAVVSARTGNCSVTGMAGTADEPYKVAITISAFSNTSETERIDVPLSLVRREFTADPPWGWETYAN